MKIASCRAPVATSKDGFLKHAAAHGFPPAWLCILPSSQPHRAAEEPRGKRTSSLKHKEQDPFAAAEDLAAGFLAFAGPGHWWLLPRPLGPDATPPLEAFTPTLGSSPWRGTGMAVSAPGFTSLSSAVINWSQAAGLSEHASPNTIPCQRVGGKRTPLHILIIVTSRLLAYAPPSTLICNFHMFLLCLPAP